jgi:RHS repeat-associated protein
MLGSGSTVVRPGVAGTIKGGVILAQRTLVNEGTLTFAEGYILMREGALLNNVGTFNANSEGVGIATEGEGATPLIVNAGTFQKTTGTGKTIVEAEFENSGVVRSLTGKLEIRHPRVAAASTEYGGPENPSTPGHPHATCGKPVSCAIGNEAETQTDFAIGGLGVSLVLARTYNSQAGAAGAHGAFGYGWTSLFSDHLVVEGASKKATLVQANGGTVPFTEGSGGSFTPPAWTQDVLSGNPSSGYTLTLANQTVYRFAGASGRLESVADRNGNETTLSYNEAGRLTTVTDPAGRKITFAYNAAGLVESAKDPMGHQVKYAYEGENLKSVTLPGETSPRWQFKYDASHQLTEMTDGRGGKTTNEYDTSHRVISQTDPAGRTLTFEYGLFHTKITNHASGGSVTDEYFTSQGEPAVITRGFGTSAASTISYSYDSQGNVLAATDGDGHSTRYGYDAAANRTSMLDADEHETKWAYNATHDVISTTTPRGETTTIKRDVHGNAEAIERPAPAGKTQLTKFKYDAKGELEQVTDPLERVAKYEYDSQGDRSAEIDPEGDKRTWAYDEDSHETSSVSPRGNVEGAEAAKYTTKVGLDAQERPLKVTDPLGHETKYAYDADGNLESLTDANGHTTKYTYDADNENTMVEQASGTTTETGYDGAGRVISQTDGNKHTTKYERNPLGEVVEVIDPLARKTTKEYDAAGNLTKLTDTAKRATTYKYDAANQLTEVSYSDGTTPTVKYEYDADGERTSMVDGTGTSTYTYDQLDRLTESKDGHGDVVGYEYDLANELTKLTYPNGKSVLRTFDNAGRLKSVTDWSEHTTKFAYDADSDQTTTTWPSGTGEEDLFGFNEADQATSTSVRKGSETLAALTYTRDNDGQLKATTQTGLPGEAETAYTYDENNRLTKAGSTAYEYDAADSPTKVGSTTQTFDAANQLEKAGTTSFTYDELGERTKSTPGSGPATTYGYDQAGNLTSVTRPAEGETPAIEDFYAYDGNGLRASQTIAGTTSYLTWDQTGSLPLLLNDGTNSYVYGPGGVPVEQISGGGTVLYLHHDQQGSTRVLTGSTGTVEGTYSFDAYGNQAGHTGSATTPLGYDGQYTNADTELIYLRARSYDPATAQFLSVDPLEPLTREPYAYTADNPANNVDPSGLEVCAFGYCIGFHPVNPLKATANFAAGFANTFTSSLPFGASFNVAAPFCGTGLSWSYGMGGVTANAETLAVGDYVAGEAGYSAATKTDLGNRLFGRVFKGVGTGPEGSEAVTGILNEGSIRIGLTWKGTATEGKNVFRLGIGNRHIDFLH